MDNNNPFDNANWSRVDLNAIDRIKKMMAKITEENAYRDYLNKFFDLYFTPEGKRKQILPPSAYPESIPNVGTSTAMERASAWFNRNNPLGYLSGYSTGITQDEVDVFKSHPDIVEKRRRARRGEAMEWSTWFSRQDDLEYSNWMKTNQDKRNLAHRKADEYVLSLSDSKEDADKLRNILGEREWGGDWARVKKAEDDKKKREETHNKGIIANTKALLGLTGKLGPTAAFGLAGAAFGAVSNVIKEIEKSQASAIDWENYSEMFGKPSEEFKKALQGQGVGAKDLSQIYKVYGKEATWLAGLSAGLGVDRFEKASIAGIDLTGVSEKTTPEELFRLVGYQLSGMSQSERTKAITQLGWTPSIGAAAISMGGEPREVKPDFKRRVQQSLGRITEETTLGMAGERGLGGYLDSLPRMIPGVKDIGAYVDALTPDWLKAPLRVFNDAARALTGDISVAVNIQDRVSDVKTTVDNIIDAIRDKLETEIASKIDNVGNTAEDIQ